MLKFGRLVRDVVQVLRGLPPDQVVRQRTLAIQEQLRRLREHRLAQEKELEAAALKDMHMVVGEMKQLLNNLNAAEAAVVEYVNQIGDEAQAKLEAQLETEAETILTVVLKSQQTVLELRGTASVAAIAAASPSQEALLESVLDSNTSDVATTTISSPDQIGNTSN